jgi:hypothetical protein
MLPGEGAGHQKLLSDRTSRLVTHSKKLSAEARCSLADLFEAFYNKFFQELDECYFGIYEESVRLRQVSVGAAFRGILEQVKEASHYMWTEVERYQ